MRSEAKASRLGQRHNGDRPEYWTDKGVDAAENCRDLPFNGGVHVKGDLGVEISAVPRVNCSGTGYHSCGNGHDSHPITARIQTQHLGRTFVVTHRTARVIEWCVSQPICHSDADQCTDGAKQIDNRARKMKWLGKEEAGRTTSLVWQHQHRHSQSFRKS